MESSSPETVEINIERLLVKFQLSKADAWNGYQVGESLPLTSNCNAESSNIYERDKVVANAVTWRNENRPRDYGSLQAVDATGPVAKSRIQNACKFECHSL